MPTDEEVDEALDLISRGSVQSAYFFDSLQDPDWIEPLRAAGFFDLPPDPVTTVEGTLHLPWPESRYLKRMASRAPNEVARAIEGFEATPNERVMIDVCEIGVELDLESQRRIGKVMRKSLTHAEGHFLLVPEAMAGLAVSISRNGDTDFARCFAHDLLDLGEAQERSGLDPVVETRIREGDYERVINLVVSELSEADPVGIFKMLCDLLERGLEKIKREGVHRDYSHYWREDIGEDHSRGTERALHSLISAIRDLALKVKSTSNVEMFRVFENNLGNRSGVIFRRLVLYIEAKPPLIDLDYCRDLLFGFQFEQEPFLVREQDLLASSVYPLLSEADKAEYLEKISLGSGSPPSGDEDLDRRRAEVWRRDRLSVLSGNLPAVIEAELDSLVAAYGAPQKSIFIRSGGAWSGPESPLDEDQIARMSATDVVEFLTSWIPPEGLMRPTPEGIARVLTKTVEKRPNDFGEVVREIKGLDPTYVRAVLEGFEKALEAGLPIDWKSVLELMETALANPNTSTSPHQRELEDRDPDWDWTRKSSASLLQKAFESEVQIIVDPRRTWKVLDALSWDPDPTPEYEAQFGGDNMDPLTLSLNTTRGRAMHAVLAAAMWAKRNEEVEVSELALANLTKHLDPGKDPSETTRGVFGSWLVALQSQYPTWFETNLEQILPEEERNKQLRSAVWNTFLAWNHPNPGLWDTLRAEYRKAIAQLSGSGQKGDGLRRSIGESLAEHLASFMWWGLVDCEHDPELREFFAQAPIEDAIHLIHVLGTSLEADENQPVDSDVLTRVVDLWVRMPDWVSRRTEKDQEKLLGSFGELYVVDALFDSLGDDELLRLTNAGVVAGPEHLMLPAVAERVWRSPEIPLRFVAAYVRNPPTLWSVDSYERELQMVIEAGIEAGGPFRDESELIVNLLVSKGHTSFRRHIDLP
ncbi:MAG: hypothetical protein KDB54_00750 [Solirubrobacterales bacterium]|nr:hypothetical protein [Solirubrobacterales bacterium]